MKITLFVLIVALFLVHAGVARPGEPTAPEELGAYEKVKRGFLREFMIWAENMPSHEQMEAYIAHEVRWIQDYEQCATSVQKVIDEQQSRVDEMQDQILKIQQQLDAKSRASRIMPAH